jgi:hypothetical protein
MNDQQSNSTQLVLTTAATGQFGPRLVCSLPRRRAIPRRPLAGSGARHWRGKAAAVAGQFRHLDTDVTEAVVTPVEREPIAFERFAREHKDAFGRPVSVP